MPHGGSSRLGYYVDMIARQYLILKYHRQYKNNRERQIYQEADILATVESSLNKETTQFLDKIQSENAPYAEPAMYKALDTVFLLLANENIHLDKERLQIAPKVPTIQKALTTIISNMENPRQFSSWKERWISTNTGEQTDKLLMLKNLKNFTASDEGYQWLKKPGNEEKLAAVVAAVCKIERYSIKNVFKKSNNTCSYDEFQREYANHTDFKLPDNNRLTDELKRCLAKDGFSIGALKNQLDTDSNQEDSVIVQSTRRY